MELAFNLSWLVLIGLLIASVLLAHRKEQLALSLKLALGCVALLALLLFPVISITDDLQQTSPLAEWSAGHFDARHLPAADFPHTAALFLLLLLATVGALLVRLARMRATMLESPTHGQSQHRRQPCAVRPPPSPLAA